MPFASLVSTLTAVRRSRSSASAGGHRSNRRSSPEALFVDLNSGSLQIGCDGFERRGLGELCELVLGNDNVGARSHVDLLVTAHVKHIGKISSEVRSPTGLIFCVFLIHFVASAVGIPFFPSSPSLLSFPFNRGLVGVDGEDSTIETRRKL